MSTSMTSPYSYNPDSYVPQKPVYRNSHVPMSAKSYSQTGHYKVPLPTYSRDIPEPSVGNNKPQRRRPVDRDNRDRRHFSGPHSKSSHQFNSSLDSHSSRLSNSSPRWSSDTSTFDYLHSPCSPSYLSERIPSTSSFPSNRSSLSG